MMDELSVSRYQVCRLIDANSKDTRDWRKRVEMLCGMDTRKPCAVFLELSSLMYLVLSLVEEERRYGGELYYTSISIAIWECWIVLF